MEVVMTAGAIGRAKLQ